MSKAKKPRPAPIALKAYSFAEVMAEAQQQADELQKKLDAMTPAEREQWEKDRQKDEAEVEGLLKQLRGPGFIEMRITPRGKA